MAKNIEIVLLEDVKDVGRAGDTCRVRTGYARNYLLPKKLATVLTPGTARL
ncbi:MAG: 50S ribosomal protein L9, partial [Kiritimatiellae bacterium]|nr:50S ribosomal protein L9 [Kiritimatiellia bacterium]